MQSANLCICCNSLQMHTALPLHHQTCQKTTLPGLMNMSQPYESTTFCNSQGGCIAWNFVSGWGLLESEKVGFAKSQNPNRMYTRQQRMHKNLQACRYANMRKRAAVESELGLSYLTRFSTLTPSSSRWCSWLSRVPHIPTLRSHKVAGSSPA